MTQVIIRQFLGEMFILIYVEKICFDKLYQNNLFFRIGLIHRNLRPEFYPISYFVKFI